MAIVRVIYNQHNQENERMCGRKGKESPILCNFWRAFKKALGIVNPHKKKRRISSFTAWRGNFLLRETGRFSFRAPQQRVDANSWPNCSHYSIPQSCWYPNPLWDGERVWRVPVYFIGRKSCAFMFIQRDFWFYVDQSPIYFSLKCLLVLKFCSYGGKWFFKRFRGRNGCYCSMLFSGSWVSGMLAFSRNLSFFCSRFLLFRGKSIQKLSLYCLGSFLQEELFSLALVCAREELQRFKFFPKRNPSLVIYIVFTLHWAILCVN